MKELTAQDLKEWHKNSSIHDRAGKTRSGKKEAQNSTEHYSSSVYNFTRDLLKKGKQLSQMIAASWLDDADFENELENQKKKPSEIRRIFKEFAKGQDDSELKELLTGKKQGVWPERIFDEQEVELYCFEVDWTAFVGKIIENSQAVKNQQPPFFTMVLPYPPRPDLNEFTVTKEEVQDWVQAPIQEGVNGLIENPYPSAAYIPLSCC
jgi:hypothetical protein